MTKSEMSKKILAISKEISIMTPCYVYIEKVFISEAFSKYIQDVYEYVNILDPFMVDIKYLYIIAIRVFRVIKSLPSIDELKKALDMLNDGEEDLSSFIYAVVSEPYEKFDGEDIGNYSDDQQLISEITKALKMLNSPISVEELIKICSKEREV